VYGRAGVPGSEVRREFRVTDVMVPRSGQENTKGTAFEAVPFVLLGVV
jgi:hypothetical protein